MRFAYVCADPGVPVFGNKGSSLHVQEVMTALRRSHIEIDLFATRIGGDPPAGLEAVRVHTLPAVPKMARADREQAAFDANAALNSALQREGPFDVLYERYSLWSFAGMEFARSQGIPGVLEVNAPLIEEQAEYRGLVNRVAAEQVAQRAFSAAGVLVAVSDEVACYLERYPGARGQVHVIANGVNVDRFRPGLAPSRPAQPGTFTVGFVGTMKPWHGLPVLVEAFATLHQRDSDTRLLIVGDGEGTADVMTDVAARGLQDAVEFTGAVAPQQVPALLASMNMAVAPYPQLRHFYFSPLKVYEYMAAGLPVVASNSGQLAKLIQQEVNGLLFPPGDVAALAAALNRLGSDRKLLVRLGKGARDTVVADHTWDTVTQQMLDLVSRLPRNKAARAKAHVG